jgi:hypothetical protein
MGDGVHIEGTLRTTKGTFGKANDIKPRNA